MEDKPNQTEPLVPGQLASSIWSERTVCASRRPARQQLPFGLSTRRPARPLLGSPALRAAAERALGAV